AQENTGQILGIEDLIRVVLAEQDETEAPGGKVAGAVAEIDRLSRQGVCLRRLQAHYVDGGKIDIIVENTLGFPWIIDAPAPVAVNFAVGAVFIENSLPPQVQKFIRGQDRSRNWAFYQTALFYFLYYESGLSVYYDQTNLDFAQARKGIELIFNPARLDSLTPGEVGCLYEILENEPAEFMLVFSKGDITYSVCIRGGSIRVAGKSRGGRTAANNTYEIKEDASARAGRQEKRALGWGRPNPDRVEIIAKSFRITKDRLRKSLSEAGVSPKAIKDRTVRRVIERKKPAAPNPAALALLHSLPPALPVEFVDHLPAAGTPIDKLLSMRIRDQKSSNYRQLFALKLRALLKFWDLPQRDITDRVGITRATLWNWTNGALPDPEYRLLLALTLGVSVEELFGDVAEASAGTMAGVDYAVLNDSSPLYSQILEQGPQGAKVIVLGNESYQAAREYFVRHAGEGRVIIVDPRERMVSSSTFVQIFRRPYRDFLSAFSGAPEANKPGLIFSSGGISFGRGDWELVCQSLSTGGIAVIRPAGQNKVFAYCPQAIKQLADSAGKSGAVLERIYILPHPRAQDRMIFVLRKPGLPLSMTDKGLSGPLPAREEVFKAGNLASCVTLTARRLRLLANAVKQNDAVYIRRTLQCACGKNSSRLAESKELVIYLIRASLLYILEHSTPAQKEMAAEILTQLSETNLGVIVAVTNPEKLSLNGAQSGRYFGCRPLIVLDGDYALGLVEALFYWCPEERIGRFFGERWLFHEGAHRPAAIDGQEQEELRVATGPEKQFYAQTPLEKRQYINSQLKALPED
ncbi:MAG: helix-turn-helix transcriptional regulator, partial [bacterium]|nr:helix-turn-helix transcriptional regulator [bacterium]